MGNCPKQKNVDVNRVLAKSENEIIEEIHELFNRFKGEYNQDLQYKYNFEELNKNEISDDDVKLFTVILNDKNLIDISNKESRAIGSFVCSAVGDAMGVHTEFLPINYNPNNLKIEKFEDLRKLKNFSSNYGIEIGEISDDTSMALCLADSIIINQKNFNSLDLRLRFFLWWHFGYNNCRDNKISNGLGGNIGESLHEFYLSVINNKINENSQSNSTQRNGNGSLMRLSPLPIAFANSDVYNFEERIKKCLKFAKDQSLTTHNGREAYECCMILSYLIIKNINFDNSKNDGIDPKVFLSQNLVYDEIIKYTLQELDYSVRCLINSKQEDNIVVKQFINEGKYMQKYNKTEIDRNWNWKAEDYKYSPTRSEIMPKYVGSYCLDALTMALHCVYHSRSSKEAILKAVNMGGDADTVAAITGQISGSIWGLDKDILSLYDTVRKYDKDKIALTAYRLYKYN